MQVGCLAVIIETTTTRPTTRRGISRILRLALLAPDLVEAILGGWADQRVMLEQLERPLPIAWDGAEADGCTVQFGSRRTARTYLRSTVRLDLAA